MPTTTLSSRRAIGNLAAQRQGLPTTQAGIDAVWTGIVGKLNATLPGTQEPVGASSNKPTPGADDWSSIVANLNAEAGLATPTRRAR
jgi:hypothetical protein